jgi:hypothetical protein
VEDLQRLAGNASQLTLEGYCVPIVTKGDGYIACLCSQDEILIYPGSQEEIDRVVELRTTSGPLMTPKASLRPGHVKQNYLGTQANRETLVSDP